MPDPSQTQFQAAVIGAGPAGLMAAEVLAQGGVSVHLYESKPSAGRKLLVAGSSGLNLTRAEPFDVFLSRYGSQSQNLKPLLVAFGADQLIDWVHHLGIETFVGSSARVFPKEMLAASFLHTWLERLKALGVHFHYEHTWQGWTENNGLRFHSPQGEITDKADAVILALGGASWPQLGSTGEWAAILKHHGVSLAPFQPANCGFEVHWSDFFRSRFAGQPLKTVSLNFTDSFGRSFTQQGEFVITEHGVEGSLIYAAGALLRDEITANGKAVFYLDLMPDWPYEKLVERLLRPRGTRSMASHLEKSVGIKGVKSALLWEFLPRDMFQQSEQLAKAIKALPIPLTAPRPIAEAISTAGGVLFSELNQDLMLRNLPGVFCAGEMLDWEAPTGGYLLTACFSSGHAAGLSALDWLNNKSKL
jgi:uncharacterized flavoprotein (TIGR03862 family)